MRSLTRLGKPDILINQEIAWRNAFIASGKTRPSNTQYGHIDIRNRLHSISFKKCFYSEVKFAADTEGQVDHYIEVSEDRNLAFDWNNLFLSHKDSNQGKPSNIVIPNDTTLNPFVHTDNEIENNLSFEDECIIAKGGSVMGLRTIQKYKLDKDIYNILRSKELIKFMKTFMQIKDVLIQETRVNLNPDEIEILRQFAQPDHAFSLMFRILLKKHGLM